MPLIRPATVHDVDDIHRLKYQLVRTWYPDPAEVDDHPTYASTLRGRITEVIDHPWYHYVVAEVDGRVVACMSASIHKALPGPDWTGINAHMGDLFVQEDKRGMGLAGMLMDNCLAWCREQGAWSARMHATRMAVPMYLKQGWQPPEPEDPDGRFLTLLYAFHPDEE